MDADEETRTVTVTVEPDQLSLAIGKRGQNARLTSKLTGWRVDIQKDEESMDFEERVAEGFRRWVEGAREAVRVDARGAAEEVHARVVAEVDRVR